MTYPVDDNGNPRVDFVWGNFPLQPNDQRSGFDDEAQYINDGWLVSPAVGSDNLADGWIEKGFPTGDGGGQRFQTFTYDSHEIATTGYSNYPAFIPNYAGDGDTGLELVMPNLAGIPYSGWSNAISAAGLNWDSDDTTYVGATPDNDGNFISQNPAAGTVVNPGTDVTTVRYLAPTVPNLVGLADPETAQAALEAVGLVLGNTDSSQDGANSGNDGKVKSQSVAAGTKVNGGSAVSIVVFDNPAVLVPNILGMTQAAAEAAIVAAGLVVGTVAHTPTGANSGNSGKVSGGVTPGVGTSVAPGTTISFIIYWYVNYAIAGIRPDLGHGIDHRTLYLNGRTSGITVGSTIVLSDTGVANYNRPFDVIEVHNDDAFNTGGQRIIIRNGLMDGTGGDVTNTGTWAFI